MKIIIIDDSSYSRFVLKKSLEELNYNDIFEASGGKEGLMLLIKENIDLIFLDWEMPKITGIQLLKAIRSNTKIKDISIVMYTGHGSKENVLSAVKAGINGYLVKPVSTQALKQIFEKLNKD